MGRILELSQRFIDQHQWSNDGPLVREAEELLAQWHGVKHCVAMSSGFWALVLTAQAIRAETMEAKSEVLMPSLTYRRLADAMNWAGWVPRFADIDSVTLALDTIKCRQADLRNVGLVCAVNPVVGTLNPDLVSGLGNELGIPVIFDSVEAQVDQYPDGSRVGSKGKAEIFSCHASKFLNGGEGGYVTTNSDSLAVKLRMARSFGNRSPEDVIGVGFNAKMSEIQAAWVITALEGVGPQMNFYKAIYEIYEWFLRDVPEIRLRNSQNDTSFKNILVEVADETGIGAQQLVHFLNKEGAQARQYYYPPLHNKETSYMTVKQDLETTEAVAPRLLLLPSGSRISVDHIARITRMMRSFFDERKS